MFRFRARSNKLIQVFLKKLPQMLSFYGVSSDKIEKVSHGEDPCLFLDENDLRKYIQALHNVGRDLCANVEEREMIQHIKNLMRLPVFAQLDLCVTFLNGLKMSRAPQAAEKVFIDNPDLLYHMVMDINSRFAQDSEEKTEHIRSLMFTLIYGSQTDFLHQVLKSFFDRHPPILSENLSEKVGKMRWIVRYLGSWFKKPKLPAETEERIDILVALLTKLEMVNNIQYADEELDVPEDKIKALPGIFFRQLEPNSDGTFGIPIQDLRQQAMNVLGCNNIQELKEYIQHCPEIIEEMHIDPEDGYGPSKDGG